MNWTLLITTSNQQPIATTLSWGINNYSVPERTVNYTAGDPAQTSVAAFQSGGAEAFFVADSHWSSTESSSTDAWILNFRNGNQGQPHQDHQQARPRFSAN